MAGATSSQPSLFDWPLRSEISAIEAKRQDLKARIDRMRPRSHRRLALEAELHEQTTKQLRLVANLLRTKPEAQTREALLRD